VCHFSQNLEGSDKSYVTQEHQQFLIDGNGIINNSALMDFPTYSKFCYFIIVIYLNLNGIARFSHSRLPIRTLLNDTKKPRPINIYLSNTHINGK